MAAELPLIYSTGRHHLRPEVAFLRPADEESVVPRRVRQTSLESEWLLQTIPAYRYAQTPKK